jgi:hypothetical protein
VNPAEAFYQVLAGTSFTLLGLWFGIRILRTAGGTITRSHGG